MPTANSLSLRINGREQKKLSLRFKAEEGFPSGQVEVVIIDDFLGTFPLTATLDVELKQDGSNWRKVTLPYLISMIAAYSD
jgi:hypothetical protein